MSVHPEILKPRQREVLRSLGPAADRNGFYLGGGTAIVYFDDADAEPKPSMIWKVSWREVKETLRGWARAVEV